jgi:hypothetical protein
MKRMKVGRMKKICVVDSDVYREKSEIQIFGIPSMTFPTKLM